MQTFVATAGAARQMVSLSHNKPAILIDVVMRTLL